MRSRRGLLVSILIVSVLIIGLLTFYFTTKQTGYVSSTEDSRGISEAQLSLTLYVSPNGDDGNDGRIDSPFATIFGARDYIRANNLHGQTPITVYLRGGEYYLSQPFVLGMQDSGSENAPIIYSSYPGERAIISSGVKLGGWHVCASAQECGNNPNWRNLWTTDTQLRFNSLFVNGERAVIARTPNEDGTSASFYRIAPRAECNYYAKTSPAYCNTTIRFSNNEINPFWRNLQDIQIVSLRRWLQTRQNIQSVTGNLVTFGSAILYRYGWDYDNRDRYFIENVFEGLDSAGEWYLDKQSGKAYYYPKPGESLSNLEVIAPQQTTFIRVSGANKNSPLVGVGFVNLELKYGDCLLINSNQKQDQTGLYHSEVPVVLFNYNTNVIFENNTINNVCGDYVIEANVGNSKIIGNEIHDVGGGGIAVNYLAKYTLLENEVWRYANNQISNNKITNINQVHYDPAAILLGETSDNNITYNYIANTKGTSVSMGFVSSFASSAENNTLAFNKITNVMTELNDGGAIYLRSSQINGQINNNIISQVLHTPKHVSDFPLVGIYFDSTARSMTVKNNVIYDTDSPINVNIAVNNSFVNNIIVDGASSDINFFGKYLNGHESESLYKPLSGNRFTRNIVYSTKNSLFLCTYVLNETNTFEFCPHNKVYLKSKIKLPIEFVSPNLRYSFSLNYSDYNLVYRQNPNNPKFNWAWLKSYGYEQHSILADPLFANYTNKNFTLLPTSRALKPVSQGGIGFQQIDTSKVGPRVECFNDNECSVGEKCLQRTCVVATNNCNSNGLCESGETQISCPEDCSQISSQNLVNNPDFENGMSFWTKYHSVSDARATETIVTDSVKGRVLEFNPWQNPSQGVYQNIGNLTPEGIYHLAFEFKTTPTHKAYAIVYDSEWRNISGDRSGKAFSQNFAGTGAWSKGELFMQVPARDGYGVSTANHQWKVYLVGSVPAREGSKVYYNKVVFEKATLLDTGEQLISNQDFEKGLSPWVTFRNATGDIRATANVVSEGSKGNVLQFSPFQNPSQGAYQNIGRLTPGEIYHFSFEFKTTPTHKAYAYLFNRDWKNITGDRSGKAYILSNFGDGDWKNGGNLYVLVPVRDEYGNSTVNYNWTAYILSSQPVGEGSQISYDDVSLKKATAV